MVHEKMDSSRVPPLEDAFAQRLLALERTASDSGTRSARPALPSGTVTFLFSDVEGSTRLLATLGDRYAGVLADHRRELRSVMAAHGGVEVDTQGDAFFFAFSSPREAVAAAAQAQGRLGEGPMRVRIGIHTGEPQVVEEGYVGIDIHRAARICSAAHGGQIVLSEPTRALVQDAFSLTYLGTHRLKDLRGPEKIFQLGDATFPPLRSRDVSNLPSHLTALIGRERELADIRMLVCRHRLVTLTGPGGSGKTRLSLEVAGEMIDEFEDGVFWVLLAALTDPELVLPTIAGTLGARDALSDHINEKRMLLLLDNLEHLTACAPALGQLLQSCPHLTLLITSRSILHLSGEQECQVAPLPPDDAVSLFRDRAVQSEPVEAVEEICRHLDGLPLAIELAAARTRTLPPDKLIGRLRQRLPLLTTGRIDAPERQRTLRATIEWSYDLLSPEEQHLFSRLAVFAGGFDIEAAEQICDADIDTLEVLLEQSLLGRKEDGRLSCLETIREFGLEKLEETGQADEIRLRHARHFLSLARSANLTNESAGEMQHELIIRDRENVRVALEWALAAGEIELGLRLAAALENYWVTNSPAEGKRWLDDLLEHATLIPGDLRALALRARGGASYIQGDYEEGADYYQASLDQYRRLGDERGIAIVCLRLALEALRLDDTDRADTFAEESLRLHRKIAFKRGEAQALGLLADMELRRGNDEAALNLLERSAILSEECGFVWWHTSVDSTV